MSNAVILHGWPGRAEYFDPAAPNMSNAHWLPWLQGQIIKTGIDAATPEVPRCYELDWKTWQHEFERFDVGPETVLVGHSAGGGFLVKYLSTHKDLSVGKVVLVAPWLDPFAEKSSGFFDDFEIAADLVQRTAGVTIFHSDNDDKDIQKTVEVLREKLQPVGYREFHNYGHFCFEDMKTTEFPELLAEVVRA